MAGRYGYIFEFLVKRLNEYTSPKDQTDAVAQAEHYIAFLDIFGFETMKSNSLEQLCINYANEQLQQQFNGATFTTEIKVYEEENLQPEILNELNRCVDASRIVARCERTGMP